jgi:hypothetical protein
MALNYFHAPLLLPSDESRVLSLSLSARRVLAYILVLSVCCGRLTLCDTQQHDNKFPKSEAELRECKPKSICSSKTKTWFVSSWPTLQLHWLRATLGFFHVTLTNSGEAHSYKSQGSFQILTHSP